MWRRILFLWTIAIPIPTAAAAQPLPPNDAGVTMGHWHLNTRDLAATKGLFVTLGGTALRIDDTDVVRFRGVDVYLHLDGEAPPPAGGTVGTVVNHVGFTVPDIQRAAEEWKARGVPVQPGDTGRVDQLWITTPDQVRIEILVNPGQVLPIQNHHVHFWLPQEDIAEMQAWYARVLGAEPGMRGRFPAADLPGVNLSFAPIGERGAGTRGRALDHIGFRVENLAEFVTELEASGIELDRPYRRNPRTGGGSAFLYDPWGTYIELTDMVAP